ncbi:MAG: transposase [candidate division WOR-3 bacterium]
MKSFKEAGNELLTSFRYPESQWKSLRRTNIIERFYGEFRRRIKTQASLPSEHAALIIFLGLFA